MSDPHPPSSNSGVVGQADFASLVLQQSHTRPVLADFWAAWCGPCKILMPRLSKLADDYQGKFFLAKIDTDKEQALATQYGIRSLPTVKVFKDGLVVDEFMGALPEPAIREMLDRHIRRPSDILIAEAMAAQERGDAAEVMALLTRAVETDPDRDRPKLHLARVLFEAGRTDDGEKILQGLSPAGRTHPEVVALRAKLEFVRLASASRPPEELEKAIADNPQDYDARYQLAARRVLQGAYEPALDQLLEIVRRDRTFRDDAARKAVLAVFNILGGQGEIVTRYRKQLSMALN
jgi:putative thioredoxin